MGRSEKTAGSRLPKWHDEGVLKTWPATPVEHRSLKPEGVALNLSELLLLTKREQPGSVSHPNIADCQLPIADFSAVELFREVIAKR